MHLVEYILRIVFRLDVLQALQITSVNVVHDRVSGCLLLVYFIFQFIVGQELTLGVIDILGHIGRLLSVKL